MKQLFTIIAVSFFAATAFAQVPQKMNYQAVLRNSSNALLVNTPIGMRISILNGSVTGAAVYVETHTTTTNENGLVTVEIGGGTVVSGTFEAIDWANGPYFIKTETDPAGGTSYSITGTSQLLSVPYALAAGKLTGTAGGTLGDEVQANRSSNFAFYDGSAGKVYAFNANLGTWSSQTYNVGYLGQFIDSANGNFAFADGYAGKVYAYSGKTGTWSAQSYNVGYLSAIQESNGSFAFADGLAGQVYAFNAKTSAWSAQSYNVGYLSAIKGTNGDFAFSDGLAGKVYVYNGITGLWTSQTYSAGYMSAIIASNGCFLFSDGLTGKVHVYSSRTGTWSSQSYSPGYLSAINVSQTN